MPLYSLAFAVLGATLLERALLSRILRAGAAALYLLTLLVTVWWSQRYPGQPARLYDSPTVATSTVGLLGLLLGFSRRGAVTHWVTALGRASFGIYLVHIIVLYYLHEALNRSGLPAVGALQAARLPVEIVVTFAVSAVLCLTWRRSARFAKVLG